MGAERGGELDPGLCVCVCVCVCVLENDAQWQHLIVAGEVRKRPAAELCLSCVSICTFVLVNQVN